MLPSIREKKLRAGGSKLIRQPRYEIQVPRTWPGLGVAEGALEEGADLAAAIDAAERPVDG